MNNEITNNTLQDDEITLKQIILIVRSYTDEFWKYKWWFPVLGFSMAGLLLLVDIFKPIKYTSDLTFLIEASSTPSMSLTSLIPSFGLGGDTETEKIIQFAKSRRIIEQLLLEKVNIDGKEDFFANHIIRSEQLPVFQTEEQIDTFYFSSTELDRKDVVAREALGVIQEYIIGKDGGRGMLETSYDEMSQIIYFSLTFHNEALAVEALDRLFFILRDFFVDKTIEKSLIPYAVLKQKQDSIKGILANKQYLLAKEQDTGKGLQREVDRLRKRQLEAEIRILMEQYIEVTKNKEMAEYSVNTLTPVVQEIDLPTYPAQKTKHKYIKSIIIGGILGGVLAAGFLFTRKLYRDTMNQEEE